MITSTPSLRAATSVDESKNEAPHQTRPIHKQPLCFRVETPFPLQSSSGAIPVTGINSTEIGFTFPRAGIGEATTLRRNNLSAGAWLNGRRHRIEREKEKSEAEALLATGSTPDHRVETMTSLPTDKPYDCPLAASFQEQKGVANDCGPDGVHPDATAECDVPFTDSLARLSLVDDEPDAIDMRGVPPKGAVEVPDASHSSPDRRDVQAARPTEARRPKDDELSKAKREIEELKDVVRTLEFRRDEYAADDGALGMAELLESLACAADAEATALRKRLDEEAKRRATYQNRYYQAVARNAELEDTLERFRRRQNEARERSSRPVEAPPPLPSRHAPPTRRVAARRGTSRKVKRSARA